MPATFKNCLHGLSCISPYLLRLFQEIGSIARLGAHIFQMLRRHVLIMGKGIFDAVTVVRADTCIARIDLHCVDIPYDDKILTYILVWHAVFTASYLYMIIA